MPSSTLTLAEQLRIRSVLDQTPLGAGLGQARRIEGGPEEVVITCSMGAINYALFGRLTAQTPVCMSAVIGDFVLEMQDRMTTEIRNSADWKGLLPAAAGTGRDMFHEAARYRLILQWVGGIIARLGLLQGEEQAAAWVAALSFPRPAQFGALRLFGAIAGRRGDEDLEQLAYSVASFLEAVDAIGMEPPPGPSIIKAAVGIAVSLIDQCFVSALGHNVNTAFAVRMGWRVIDPVGLLRQLTLVDGHAG